MTVSWLRLSPLLKRNGFCVFALDLPARGTVSLEESAAVLSAFIDKVRDRTDADRVSIVGHSQGGALARYVARFKGRLDVIDRIIGLAAPNHGTMSRLAGIFGNYLDCPACLELKANSRFILQLNAGDEAPPPILYTMIATREDSLVTPVESQALAGPQATNIVLQDICSENSAYHWSINYDRLALDLALNALNRTAPGLGDFVPYCERESESD